jgi:hypothetical protein
MLYSARLRQNVCIQDSKYGLAGIFNKKQGLRFITRVKVLREKKKSAFFQRKV